MPSRFVTGWAARLVRTFNALDLTRHFALAGGAVALLAMLLIGAWVSQRVRDDSIASAATSTARFMDSFVAPLAQELQSQETFSIGPIRALDEVLASPQLRDRVVSVKIWKPDGRIAYARDVEMIGQTFEPSSELKGALAGRIVAELDALDEPESAGEAQSTVPLLEIYSPIRAEWTGEVIGVAEFYENATDLVAQLERARLQGWLVTAAATALICMTLFAIVHRGGRTIADQRSALAARLTEVEEAARQNRALRQQVERASMRLSELNESNLRRLGADLHDGPTQLISLVALRLDALSRAPAKDRKKAHAEVAQALDAALSEIRQISRGMVLPELAPLSLAAVIERAVTAHETRSRTSVEREIAVGPVSASEAAKICAYRFVQEGLNNAFRHAGGRDQTVTARLAGSILDLRVTNGVQLNQQADPAPGQGMGLAGLRDRVESLGGDFRFNKAANGKAVLEMTLDISKGIADA